MKMNISTIVLSVFTIFCVGCTGNTPEVSTTTEVAKKPTTEQIQQATQKTEAPKENIGNGGTDPLLNPSLANATAPATYTVLLTTTKGDVLIEVQREWAPNGADRLYNLVKVGYFTNIAFFRVIGEFMAQFGMHGDPQINSVWKASTLMDDPVRESNARGYVTFAKTNAPNSRSTQLFINYGNNKNLDSMGFAPIGKVVDEPGKGGGMSVIDKLYAGYGEGAPRGKGPDQRLLGAKGNSYLQAEFPNLDYILSARVCGEDAVENAPEYCP